MFPHFVNSEIKDKKFYFENEVIISGDDAEKAKNIMELFADKMNFSVGSNGIITVAAEETEEHSEEYRIVCDENGITVSCCKPAALRYALASLCNLIKKDENGFYITECEIYDYPEIEYRSIMLDLARGIKPMDEVKSDVVFIAKSRARSVHFHLNDQEGLSFEMDSLPKGMLIENAYTKSEMRELAELCNTLELEAIPEFDTPAHGISLNNNIEGIRCSVPGKTYEETGIWLLCTGTEKLYGIVEAAIKEICNVFCYSKYFHIGGDEIEFGDIPQMNAFCLWDKCEKCTLLRKKLGLKNREEQYYYYINRINDIVKSCGKTTVMWSDQIDCTKPKGLSDDIIMQYWRIAAEKRGPNAGCSFNGQLSFGYRFINSDYPETYGDMDEYMSAESLSDWHPQKRPECGERYKNQIIGSEMCCWEYGNPKYIHYKTSLRPMIALFSDKLWKPDVKTYDTEYMKSVTRFVLGNVSEKDFDMFICFGGPIPPRKNDLAYFDKLTCTEEEMTEVISMLEELVAENLVNVPAAKKYLTAIKEIKKIHFAR